MNEYTKIKYHLIYVYNSFSITNLTCNVKRIVNYLIQCMITQPTAHPLRIDIFKIDYLRIIKNSLKILRESNMKILKII